MSIISQKKNNVPASQHKSNHRLPIDERRSGKSVLLDTPGFTSNRRDDSADPSLLVCVDAMFTSPLFMLFERENCNAVVVKASLLSLLCRLNNGYGGYGGYGKNKKGWRRDLQRKYGGYPRATSFKEQVFGASCDYVVTLLSP